MVKTPTKERTAIAKAYSKTPVPRLQGVKTGGTTLAMSTPQQRRYRRLKEEAEARAAALAGSKPVAVNS